MISLALLAAAHVAATPPPSANQFSLICEGHRMVATDPGPEHIKDIQVVEGEPYSAIYAIDLDAHLSWLVGSSETPFQLTVVPGRFIITSRPAEIIERTDGTWIKTQPYVKGVCHKAPFTPMPKQAF